MQVGGDDADKKEAFVEAIKKSNTIIEEYKMAIDLFLKSNPSESIYSNKLKSSEAKAKGLVSTIKLADNEFKGGNSLGGVYYLQKIYLFQGYLEAQTKVFPESQILKDHLQMAYEAIQKYGSTDKYLGKMEENKKDMMDQATDMAAKAKEVATEKLADVKEDAAELVSEAKEKAAEMVGDAKEAFDSAKEKISELVDADKLKAEAAEKIADVKAAAADLKEDAAEALNAAKAKVSELVNEEKLNELKAEAAEKLGDLKDEAEEALNKAKDKANELAGEAEEAVQEVAKKAKGFFSRLFGK